MSLILSAEELERRIRQAATGPAVKRLRWGSRPTYTRTLPSGEALQVRSFGLQVGYWPCLKAPFVSLAFNRRRYELWYGLPSYRTGGA